MRTITVVALAGAALLGCKEEPKPAPPTPSSSVPAGGASSPTPPAPAPKIEPAALHAFFPSDEASGYERRFSPDQREYAEAKLVKAGKEVATLGIASDVKPLAKAQLEASTDKLDGFPVAKFGEKESCVLVNERLQVKVVSTTLDHEARKALLAKFDLKGLATLAGPPPK